MTVEEKAKQTAARKEVLDRLTDTMRAAGQQEVIFVLMEPERCPDYVAIYPNASQLYAVEACIEDDSLIQMVRDVMEAMP